MTMDWSYILDILPTLLQATLVTLRITFMGMALACVVGLFLAIGRLSHRRAIRLSAGAFVELIRLTPLLV